MTKAEKIRHLYALGLSTREIADLVGCAIEYVRVAARQRKDGRTSEIDKRYVTSPLGKATIRKRHAERYANDPEYRRKHDENARKWPVQKPEKYREWRREYDRRRRAENRA